MTILRSLLFVPGNKPSMLAKALGLTPDAYVPDLGEPQRMQRVLHCLPLRIEDAPLRGDVHPGEETRHQAAAQMRRAAS